MSDLNPSSGSRIEIGSQLLRSLGVSRDDLSQPSVTVNSDALCRLLQSIASQHAFDSSYYRITNADVEAAWMTGELLDLRQHYIETGFFEGRLPHEIPFDHRWYHSYYPDLSDAFSADDADGLRNHYLTTGLAEGRIGRPEDQRQAHRG